jgi:hypothetical protein
MDTAGSDADCRDIVRVTLWQLERISNCRSAYDHAGQDMTKTQMILMEIITLDGAEWKDIVDYIRDKKIKITNWNKVRSELQELINSGMVYRVQQVKSEIYVRTT